MTALARLPLLAGPFSAIVLRVSVVCFHCGLGSLFLVVGGMLLAQGRINAAWEQGFYGQRSWPTAGFEVGGGISLSLAAFEALCVLGYVLGLRSAAWGLVSTSVLFALLMPMPFSIVSALSAGAIVYDLLPARPPPEPEEEG